MKDSKRPFFYLKALIMGITLILMGVLYQIRVDIRGNCGNDIIFTLPSGCEFALATVIMMGLGVIIVFLTSDKY